MSPEDVRLLAQFVIALFVGLLPSLWIAGTLVKSDADYLDLYYLDREKWEEQRRKHYGG